MPDYPDIDTSVPSDGFYGKDVPIYPQITFQARSYDPIEFASRTFPGISRDEALRQLLDQTIWVEGWPYPLKHGDFFTLYGTAAIAAQNSNKYHVVTVYFGIPTATLPVPLSTGYPATSTPIPTASPAPTPEPTSTPIPTASPAPTPEPTSTPAPTASPAPTPTPTPTSTPTPTPTTTASPTPTPTGTEATPTPTASPTPSSTEATPTPTPSPTNSPTPTPTAAPIGTGGRLPLPGQSVSYNGITLYGSGTGAGNYPPSYTDCSVSMPANSMLLGGGGGGTYTVTFSEPVNNIQILGAGQNASETFTFAVNNGTLTTALMPGVGCYATLSGNTVGNSSVGAFGATITSTSDYTEISITFPGGSGGTLFSIQQSSI